MKSYSILDRKFQIENKSKDRDLNSKINLVYYEIFEYYNKLSYENIQNIRLFIDNFFSRLKPNLYKNEDFKNELKGLLYPDIYFVGLAHLYSDDGYLQYSFLIRTYDEIKNELSKKNENNRKIK